MEDFLKGLYSSLPSWARVLSDPIVSRLMAVFNWIFGLMRATITPWRTIVNGAKALRAGAGNLGFETLATLYWLRNVYVPRLANGARDAAIRTLTTLLNRTIVPIVRSILDLRTWTLGKIAWLAAMIDLARRWAEANIRSLHARALRLERRIFTDWATPARLAAWLVGAMWTALWRYGWGQLDRLAEFFWRRRQAILFRSVAEIERQLGRLL